MFFKKSPFSIRFAKFQLLPLELQFNFVHPYLYLNITDTMMAVDVHQFYNTDIVSIPNAIRRTLGLYLGKDLNLSIVIPYWIQWRRMSLWKILAESPRDSFSILNERSQKA